MQDQIDNVITEMEMLRKSQKEMQEIKSSMTEIKNADCL